MACSAAAAIGTSTRNYVDAARGGRVVGVRIDYPAQSAGSNTDPLRDCGWPSFGFGHGFTISADAYQWLRDALVPSGIVLLRPTTESGLSPSHGEFARDLTFVQQAIRSDVFFARVLGPQTIVGGHSMGGGAAFLAAGAQAPSAVVVTFAPAETNPSAIAAAANIQAPVLVLTGSRDCVTPFAQHAGSILAALPSPDVRHHDLSGASHCQFSDGSFTCSLGENSCGGSATVSSAAQQLAARTHLLPWLQQRLGTSVFTNGFEPDD